MRVIAIVGVVAAAVAVVAVIYRYFPDVAEWAILQQRVFQNALAQGVHGLRAGEPGAWLSLLGAAGAYGFVHAVGPGHGKYLIGGVGLGQRVSAERLLGIALASSLAQAAWAIILVYGGFYLLELSAHTLTTLADTYLASASYLAIGAIGGALVWRGIREFRISSFVSTHSDSHGHTHSDECGCHAHGPSPEAVASLTSVRDAIVLILSIAIRPCTGAIFLLVIAWQLDILWAGAAAVITMGVGTGMLTSVVAISSVFARGLAVASTGRMGMMAQAFPTLQILSGLLIIWFSALLFNVDLSMS